MRYMLALLFPPAAVLLCGKPVQALLSIPLTLCFWLPGVIHAFAIVGTRLADNRARSQSKAIGREMRRAARYEH